MAIILQSLLNKTILDKDGLYKTMHAKFDNLTSHQLELVSMAATELDLLTGEFLDGVLSKDEYRTSVYEILDNRIVSDFYGDSEQRSECLKQFQQLMTMVKTYTDI